jgi:regulator of protease activity HflC (stomatin/prohibitin superfamily)
MLGHIERQIESSPKHTASQREEVIPPMLTFRISSCLYGFFLIILVFTGVVALFAFNYDHVEQDEFAVVMNSYTMNFRGNVYNQGIYILAPGDELIRFKRTLQSIELGEMDCLTKDEVLIDLHVATQFQYNSEDLIPFVLLKFESDHKYKIFIASIMRSIILNTCLQFTALQYYEKRALVDLAMYKNLVDTINSRGFGFTVEYFQLVDIQYPKEYMDILHEKQNIKQNLVTAENHRTSSLIAATTAKLEAERTASINLINARNTYNITIYKAETQRNAIVSQWINRGHAFQSIMTDLHLTVPELIAYLKADVVRSSNLIVGL